MGLFFSSHRAKDMETRFYALTAEMLLHVNVVDVYPLQQKARHLPVSIAETVLPLGDVPSAIAISNI